MKIGKVSEGHEAGVPRGGGAVDDIIGDIHKCIGEALLRLLMDYDDGHADCSSLPGPKCDLLPLFNKKLGYLRVD
jgi:hypothetical protein